MKNRSASAFGALMLSFAAASCAQQPPSPAAPTFTAKPLQVSPVTGDDKREIVLIGVTLPAGGSVPMHTHPGDCVGSVAAGEVELLVEGKPPRKLTPGESYANPRGTVHGFRNTGGGEARLMNNLVADKGQPRMVPAPAK